MALDGCQSELRKCPFVKGVKKFGKYLASLLRLQAER
jgi:hypothetical protein